MDSNRRPVFSLPESLRVDLAAAWGPVVDSESLLDLLNIWGAAVCVGDYVARLCLKALPKGIYTIIIDWVTRRGESTVLSRVELEAAGIVEVVKISNAPGTVDLRALEAVCRVLERMEAKKRIAIMVDGEEDMLAIVAADCSEWPIVYGLPGVGSVVLPPGPLRRVKVGSSLRALNPLLVEH